MTHTYTHLCVCIYIINFGLQTATLISSTAPDVTRTECGNVLRSMGVTVALEDAGGWGTLRCNVERIQGLFQ